MFTTPSPNDQLYVHADMPLPVVLSVNVTAVPEVPPSGVPVKFAVNVGGVTSSG